MFFVFQCFQNSSSLSKFEFHQQRRPWPPFFNFTSFLALLFYTQGVISKQWLKTWSLNHIFNHWEFWLRGTCTNVWSLWSLHTRACTYITVYTNMCAKELVYTSEYTCMCVTYMHAFTFACIYMHIMWTHVS